MAKREVQGAVLSLVLNVFCPQCHVAAPGQLLWAGSERVDSVSGAPNSPVTGSSAPADTEPVPLIAYS